MIMNIVDCDHKPLCGAFIRVSEGILTVNNNGAELSLDLMRKEPFEGGCAASLPSRQPHQSLGVEPCPGGLKITFDTKRHSGFYFSNSQINTFLLQESGDLTRCL